MKHIAAGTSKGSEHAALTPLHLGYRPYKGSYNTCNYHGAEPTKRLTPSFLYHPQLQDTPTRPYFQTMFYDLSSAAIGILVAEKLCLFG